MEKPLSCQQRVDLSWWRRRSCRLWTAPASACLGATSSPSCLVWDSASPLGSDATWALPSLVWSTITPSTKAIRKCLWWVALKGTSGVCLSHWDLKCCRLFYEGECKTQTFFPPGGTVYLGPRDGGNDPRLLLLGIHRHTDPRWLYMSKICCQQVNVHTENCVQNCQLGDLNWFHLVDVSRIGPSLKKQIKSSYW